MTAGIGGLAGRLRAVHLAAHVKMRAVLSDEQVRAYDALRGYSRAEGKPERHGGGGLSGDMENWPTGDMRNWTPLERRRS